MTESPEKPQNPIFKTLDQLPTQTWYLLGFASVAISAALQAAGKKNAADFVGKWPPTFFAVGIYHELFRPKAEYEVRITRDIKR